LKEPRIQFVQKSMIESSYLCANDWINNTGAGSDYEVTLQNYVKSLCPYYYDVHEVFSDRAYSFASYTNERNFDGNVESKDSRDNDDTNTGTGTDTNDETGTNNNKEITSNAKRGSQRENACCK